MVGNLAFAAARPAVAAAAEYPIGAHSMLQLDDPYSFMQIMFAQAAGMGATTIRLDVAPALVFTAPSQPPDFSGLDEVMALSEQYHLQVVGDLFTIPAWIATCQAPTGPADMDRCGTDDLADYQSMIAQIVTHADPIIRDWEIWNEPDNGEFFTGSPQQYAQMLRTAYDAIKAVDPQDNVLLGGISSTSGMSWLAQVFATPGADAAHAFDTANIHERGWLDSLAGDVTAWKRFLAGYGFTGPLWVTEHGYPSDPAFQYDPSYTDGLASQAAYLTASIPTLIDAGAAEVFVTERDNGTGEFASEGVLGGDVADPPVADPVVVQKPAYAAVRAIAACYAAFGRDCPGSAPAASPASVAMPAAPLPSASVSTVSVSDPGTGPVQLGTLALESPSASPIAIQSDGCSNLILEPNQTCAVALRFAPTAGGDFTATLRLPSDNGTLSIPITAVSPSVSSLTSPHLVSLAFTPTGAADGVGHTQRLVLELTNPLRASVHIVKSTLSGAQSRRFSIQSDDCAGAVLAPRRGCHVSVLFDPTQAGTAQAALTLSGNGTPLSIPLSATAFALPTVALLGSTEHGPCLAPGSPNLLRVETNQSSSVTWRAVRESAGHLSGCSARVAKANGASGRSSASGHTQTVSGHGSRRHVATFTLPLGGGRTGLRPGVYQLTITASNAHGSGPSQTTSLTILP